MDRTPHYRPVATSPRPAAVRRPPGRPFLPALVVLGALLMSGSVPVRSAPPVVRPNPNLERAGVLRDGVLRVTLEAKESTWWFNGPGHPPQSIEAFAEPDKPPLMPGPLIRVPAGTELRISVRNSLRLPLTFFVPASIHGGPDGLAAVDSVVVAPGGAGTVIVPATTPGNYLYRATTPTGTSRWVRMAGLLAGAVVVDTARATSRPDDRVFVIMGARDAVQTACIDTSHAPNPDTACPGLLRFTINGRSWPHTERIHATVGDSLRWRVINASNEPHPMHLHGFYYRVDAFSGPMLERFGQPARGQMVVTQLLSPYSAMSMAWSPDRPGNWLFHCHFVPHTTPDSAEAAPDDPYLRDMAGLVLGTIVTARRGEAAAGDPGPVRQLRLVAEDPDAADGVVSSHAADSLRWQLGSPDSVPFMRFVLEERGRRADAGRDFSSEIDLVRGEPVAITIVNHIGRPISVHWHGIEVEDSYVDGVPGFSGEGTHLTPAIAPGDSFVARFTPPRAGTFMYHAHVDEIREDLGGLEGALLVHEPGERPSADDHVFFLKGLGISRVHPIEIDGRADPDTVVLHVGRPARLRLLNLSTVNMAPLVSLTARPDSAMTIARDTMLVRWVPAAKDGFDRPAAERRPEPADQILAVGETYDFEYKAEHPGTLRLEVRTNGAPHRLLLRVPIRVDGDE